MIILGCDHGGFKLKEQIKTFLTKEGESIVDVGAFKFDKEDDFSKFVLLMRSAFSKDNSSKIIAVCHSGIGMSIGLNKYKGIRCALGVNEEEIKLARKHNDINAIAFGEKDMSIRKAKKIIRVFLETESLGGKYKRRMDEIELKN